MHYSLLVIADGTKTLKEIMQPFNYDHAFDNGLYENAKWDWYVVGGRFFGYLDAKIGGHGERIGSDFKKGIVYSVPTRPYNDGRFDIARVKDIQTLNPYWFHDMLTPDGVWHQSVFYDPERITGKCFLENTWFNDGLLERLQERYPNCLAIVVDYHI